MSEEDTAGFSEAAQTAAESTEHATPKATTTSGFWAGLWRRLRGASTEERLAALNRAIAIHPDSPENYVLRGELYLNMRINELALLDFEFAQQWATNQYTEADWGVLAQALQDRAEIGAQRARKRLNQQTTR